MLRTPAAPLAGAGGALPSPPNQLVTLQTRGGPDHLAPPVSGYDKLGDSQLPEPFRVDVRPAPYTYPTTTQEATRTILFGQHPTPLSDRKVLHSSKSTGECLPQNFPGRVRGGCTVR